MPDKHSYELTKLADGLASAKKPRQTWMNFRAQAAFGSSFLLGTSTLKIVKKRFTISATKHQEQG